MTAIRAALETALNRIWARRGAPARLLWPLSCLFRAAVYLRRRRFDSGALKSGKLPVPLIVVGSVMVGGTGKTPVIIALVRHFQAAGIRVGVISRGYGRRVQPLGDDGQEVRADSDPQGCGDEPLLIHRKTGVPVFVARQRLNAAHALLAQHPQTQMLLADDGLQHYALVRDAEICVLDARATGNGFLLPAGPLREPWPRRPAAPVQWVLHAAPPVVDGFAAERVLADHAVRADGSTVALSGLKNRPVQALAAIAQPQAFFDMLRARGLTLAATFALPDHADLAAWPPPEADMPLLCTEKDAVKLWPHLPQALAVPLDVRLPEDFLQTLDAAVRGWLLEAETPDIQRG